MKIDKTTHELLQSNEYQTLIDAAKIVHKLPRDLENRMVDWKNLEIGAVIPDADITVLTDWVAKGKPTDHGHKVARLLLWYICKKYLRMPQFQRVVLEVSLKK